MPSRITHAQYFKYKKVKGNLKPVKLRKYGELYIAQNAFLPTERRACEKTYCRIRCGLT